MLAPGLTGCSSLVTAAIGIGIDDAGELVAAVHVCGGNLDDGMTSAVLVTDDDRSSTIGSWIRESPLVLTERWTLGAPSGSWHPTGPDVDALDPGVRYAISAFGADEATSTGFLSSSPADLDGLQPGQVLVARYPDDPALPVTLVPIPFVGMHLEPC